MPYSINSAQSDEELFEGMRDLIKFYIDNYPEMGSPKKPLVLVLSNEFPIEQEEIKKFLNREFLDVSIHINRLKALSIENC